MKTKEEEGFKQKEEGNKNTSKDNRRSKMLKEVGGEEMQSKQVKGCFLL